MTDEANKPYGLDEAADESQSVTIRLLVTRCGKCNARQRALPEHRSEAKCGKCEALLWPQS